MSLRPRSRGEILLEIYGADKGTRTLRRTFPPELLPDKPLQREPRREDAITSGLVGSADCKTCTLRMGHVVTSVPRCLNRAATRWTLGQLGILTRKYSGAGGRIGRETHIAALERPQGVTRGHLRQSGGDTLAKNIAALYDSKNGLATACASAHLQVSVLFMTLFPISALY